jgi:uncharacterized repeat protein (TIGR03837 family)
MVGLGNAQRWDIFCRIIDNYGDIGVCWRLARQLQQECGTHVRLWIDDLQVAERLIPAIQPELPSQFVDQVEISLWEACFPETVPADVVIEAFACDIPQTYLEAMADSKPVWLNLEYLSAESWVRDFHLKPSPHARLPLIKYFYFPGFAAETGGLLREQGLMAAREGFQGSAELQAAFCKKFGIAELGTKVSLFCYPHAAIAALLDDMATSSSPVHCLVSDPKLALLAEDWLGESLVIGKVVTKGRLSLQQLPFLSQQDYDRLLWLCALNFVRGEDSWLRAIWAARPFVWQPYRQEEDTHLAKLEAFLDVYTAYLGGEARHAISDIHRTWAEGHWRAGDIDVVRERSGALQAHATQACQQLASQPDLVAKLVIFCKNLF